MVGFSRVLSALTAISTAALLTQCRSPTQVTLQISTDVDCSAQQGTSITIGNDGVVETSPPLTSTRECVSTVGGLNFIGTFVITPSGDKGAGWEVKVVTGVDVAPDACQAPDYKGCIVARRIMRFVPHTPLDLPIEMRVDCKDEPCTALTTCVNRSCVPANVPNPDQCTDPNACDFSDSGAAGDVTVDQTVQDAPADGGSDLGPGDADGSVCAKQACGNQCGMYANDGCGDMISCTCGPGETCYTLADKCVPTDAGADACVPTGCGNQCGTQANDGCGNHIICNCQAPLVCDDAQNMCVTFDGGTDGCVPMGCGLQCGPNATDGCGHPLSGCSCPPLFTCDIPTAVCVPFDAGADSGPDGEVDPNEPAELNCILLCMSSTGPAAQNFWNTANQVMNVGCVNTICASDCGGTSPLNPTQQCADCIFDNLGPLMSCGFSLGCQGGMFAPVPSDPAAGIGGGGTPDGSLPDTGSFDTGMPDADDGGCGAFVQCAQACGMP